MSFLSVSLSLPVLALSSLHLFVLLAVSLCCSSSALHQIEADSCHQTYFRHWHTHNLAHSSLHTLFVTFSCYSSILLFDSIWMYLPDRVCVCFGVCVCVSLCAFARTCASYCFWGLFLRLCPYNTESGGRQKQKGNESSTSSCLFPSICFLSLSFFFSVRRLLWAHIL